jgi:hypothetical protein
MSRRLFSSLLAWCALLLAAPGMAQSGARVRASTEARLQAAYLLKFAPYVEWPAGRRPAPGGALVIGMVDADDVADEVRIIAERLPPQTRPAVRTLRAGDSLAGVQIVYVGGSDWPRYARWVQQAQTNATLLVSSHAGALDYGSMINFKLVEERLRFEVSLDSIEQAGLKIGSPLLALAVSVNRGK